MTRSDRFASLVEIMHRLRAPGGCPWDREQSHDSLKPYLIEEAYEVIEAIEDGSDVELCDELGDLLLQVVFHAELASERRAFTIDDVIGAIRDKLVRRHPHVFADVKLQSSEEVAANWSKIKAAERRERSGGERPSALAGVPRGLPALVRAHRLGEKAASVGFDWSGPAGARKKVDEELAEVDHAAHDGDGAAVADELGDLMFAVASYTRKLGLNAENVLRAALDRFTERFQALEEDIGGDAHDTGDLRHASAAELDAAWERAKLRRGQPKSG